MDFWETQRIAYEVLYREAAAIDEQRWDDWLELFTKDCLYWVPAWKSDTEMVNNWQNELSLIFYKSRAGLEDRVWRIRSGQSAASDPPPRTAHLVSNVLASQAEAGVAASASFVTHLFFSKNKKEQVFFGRLEYLLVPQGEAWRIARRKTILLNDYIPAVLDIYCI
jgi:3-phenylpropionate/cinnamic acid dioxygenase small subunit